MVVVSASHDSCPCAAPACVESPAALRARVCAASAVQTWRQPPHCRTTRLLFSLRRYCQWSVQHCPLSHSEQCWPRLHCGQGSHARRLLSASGSIGRAVIGIPFVTESEPGMPTTHDSLPSHLTAMALASGEESGMSSTLPSICTDRQPPTGLPASWKGTEKFAGPAGRAGELDSEAPRGDRIVIGGSPPPPDPNTVII